MVCGHTTLFLSTHFLFQHYLIASPTPSWMGTLWWPCSKGKSPSREPSSSTAARTQKWSASIALTASRRSSFCRYWQEAFPSLFSLSVLRLCLYHNAFFFFLRRSCVLETSTTLMSVTPSTYPSRNTGSSLCGIPQAPGLSAAASVRVNAPPNLYNMIISVWFQFICQSVTSALKI